MPAAPKHIAKQSELPIKRLAMGFPLSGSPAFASAILPPCVTSGSRQASQGVLIDLAVFHDDDQVFARIFQQLDVGNRITVNQQQVIASQAPLGTSR